MVREGSRSDLLQWRSRSGRAARSLFHSYKSLRHTLHIFTYLPPTPTPPGPHNNDSELTLPPLMFRIICNLRRTLQRQKLYNCRQRLWAPTKKAALTARLVRKYLILWFFDAALMFYVHSRRSVHQREMFLACIFYAFLRNDFQICVPLCDLNRI